VTNRWWWINDHQLIELSGLHEFYDSVRDDTNVKPASSNSADIIQPATELSVMTDDQKLARIDELETLLREDKARKAKFQKRKRQQQWECELADLWQDLG
jgi:hypothetical protein